MQLTFLGATSTVTGSKYLLSVNGKKFLIDCGLFQGYKELKQRNWAKFPVNPEDIDAVIITHAHIDHTGYLPVLIKKGFKGKIYCTAGTKALSAILLPDSGYLQEEDAARANRHGYSKHKPALPLYTQQDGINAISQFHALPFNKAYQLADGLILHLLPAGHIIGSAFVQLTYQDKVILFTGDLGRLEDPIMKPPTVISDVDYLITEATYGDRLHEDSDPYEQMAEAIQEAVARGGSIIIPAFAVGRTQDVLYYLYLLKKAKRIPDIPVFLDSPMAQDVSDLLIDYSEEHRLSSEQCKAICSVAKYIRTPEESKALDKYSMPVIIISASGMIEGGRILHHLKAFLPDERHTILLTGYQAPGTRGERLLKGEAEIKIHGELIPVRAKIVLMQNMSAHADYKEMMIWLKNLKRVPRKVFITHGDQEASQSLKEKLKNTYHFPCMVPEYLQTEKLG
jgi:metallo-beta-lactamase family protein